MYIGINKDYCIKQINDITDPSLTTIEVDRRSVFGDFSDRRILSYCYKPLESGYSIYPAMDLMKIEMNDLTDSSREYRKELNAASVVFVTMAETGQIDAVTAGENLDMFSEWAYPVAYAVDQLRTYNGKLYKCVQAHTSQADWTPDVVPALWSLTADPSEPFPQWAQPIGAHDAYDSGARVSHNGKHWMSTVEANVWEPGVYGWEEVDE